MGGGVGVAAGAHARAPAARRRGGRRPPVRVLRERHDLPGRDPGAAGGARAAAAAAECVFDRARDGRERRLSALGHREPAEHARRNLEPGDVRRLPRPHAARSVGRARDHLRLPAVGVPPGAGRAVPGAAPGGAGDARPIARDAGPSDVRGCGGGVARGRVAAARRHRRRRAHGPGRAARSRVRDRAGGLGPAAVLRLAVRRDAGLRADRCRRVDRPAGARRGRKQLPVARRDSGERRDGHAVEPDLQRPRRDLMAQYRSPPPSRGLAVAGGGDELHLRGQPAAHRLDGQPDRG